MKSATRRAGRDCLQPLLFGAKATRECLRSLEEEVVRVFGEVEAGDARRTRRTTYFRRKGIHPQGSLPKNNEEHTHQTNLGFGEAPYPEENTQKLSP